MTTYFEIDSAKRHGFTIFFIVIAAILLFFMLREFHCWFTKTHSMMNMIQKNHDLLEKLCSWNPNPPIHRKKKTKSFFFPPKSYKSALTHTLTFYWEHNNTKNHERKFMTSCQLVVKVVWIMLFVFSVYVVAFIAFAPLGRTHRRNDAKRYPGFVSLVGEDIPRLLHLQRRHPYVFWLESDVTLVWSYEHPCRDSYEDGNLENAEEDRKITACWSRNESIRNLGYFRPTMELPSHFYVSIFSPSDTKHTHTNNDSQVVEIYLTLWEVKKKKFLLIHIFFHIYHSHIFHIHHS